MSEQALLEEENLFREDAEERRHDNDVELRPKEPSTFVNIHG
jgi:hypothetical protein